MAGVLRRFGFKKSEPRVSEARLKLQKELFSFNECTTHGFPNKPSALAYDPKLKLFAIGTKTGAIRIYGAPGVEVSGQHDAEQAVTRMFFLPEQGRLVSLTSDNSLHLWEINNKDGKAVVEEVKEFSMEASKLKTISACCLTSSANQLLVGTEGGNIQLLDTTTFKLSDKIIYQDVVMQNVPDDFKVNPGAVEAIAQHPTDPEKFLIGYNRGLIVLWDNKESNAEQTYNASQQLESLSWHRNGTEFMSAHADGSYIIWSTSDSTKPKELASAPYGPFPCKAINKIEWKTAKADPFIFFSGGMPRASYGDRHTLSVMQGAMHVVFDFTSRVIDFAVLSTSDDLDDQDKAEYDDPHSLLVLVEEELVAIDLQSEGWQTYRSPYLCSLHSSAITCSQHVTNIPEPLWEKVVDAGSQQMNNMSSRTWPVQGGKNLQHSTGTRDLLLTGHEDGAVRFWDASSSCLSLLYKLSTASIFGDILTGDQVNADADEEWPPFRKIGTFDPYSDDPRLGVQKISLCPLSETLVVGGTAGQVVVLQLEREEREQEVKVTTVNIVREHDNFVWKGHEALAVKGGDVKFPPGFQPACVMQLQPPAACTALALQSEWQLVAAGTAHGFGVFDYVQKKEVTAKCTLNPADLTGTADSAMARRKSFKKSLRESFRRLRHRRSHRITKRKDVEQKQKVEEVKPAETAPAAAEGEQPAAATTTTTEVQEEGAAAAAEPAPAPKESPKKKEPKKEPEIVITQESPKPVERQIEARAATDDMSSMVRVLYFADTFLLNAQNHTPTLWAGTNAGTIFVYQITLPASDKRESDAVACQLGKEIHLRHHAPVISICIVDRNAQPLPGPLEIQHERAKAPDMTGHHQVVICSEEQFKIFALPSLKAHNKYKLTAIEGARVRKVGFVNFRSRSDERYAENDLVCMTNQGDVHIFTIPHLRRQLKSSCIRKDNVTGIGSSVFTQSGEGFYLCSPSEFARFTLSARFITRLTCEVELKEGMRPEAPEPEPEPVVEAAAVADTAAAGVGDGDKAAEADKTTEDMPAEGANDTTLSVGVNESVASGDITADSVRVHISEESSKMEVMESQVTKTVVTKTVVSETIDDGTVTRETTTVHTTSSAEGAAASSAGGSSNLDDDTKLTKVLDETSESTDADAMEDLYISEEGDNDVTSATSGICPTAESSAASGQAGTCTDQIPVVIITQASVPVDLCDETQEEGATGQEDDADSQPAAEAPSAASQVDDDVSAAASSSVAEDSTGDTVTSTQEVTTVTVVTTTTDGQQTVTSSSETEAASQVVVTGGAPDGAPLSCTEASNMDT